VEKPNRVEVREFFWYVFGHCYHLQPVLSNWEKTKPADVNFVLTPAAMNPVWEQNARGFYAVQMMGKLTPALHDQLFKAIHAGNQRIFDQKSLATFYKGQGVDETRFNSLYNSFAVTGKVSQSKALATRYKLDGVPALVVNGKYIVRGTDQKTIDVVNFLVQKERATLGK
ncbi:MAG: thiol:disulfide interchange protein DsbA/DsbL, partial [Moraxellaceae bacterium]